MKRLKRSHLRYFFNKDRKRRGNNYIARSFPNLIKSATLINNDAILQFVRHLEQSRIRKGFLSACERKAYFATEALLYEETFIHYLNTCNQVKTNQRFANSAFRYK